MAITPNGRAAFGRYCESVRRSPQVKEMVRQWLEAKRPNDLKGFDRTDFVDRPLFAEWLTDITGMTDSPIKDNQIGRLERGEGSGGPSSRLLIALVASKIFHLPPDGALLTHDSAVDVLTEKLDPFTGERKKSGILNGAAT